MGPPTRSASAAKPLHSISAMVPSSIGQPGACKIGRIELWGLLVMELNGSSYFYALAAVSTTFVGFSSLIMTFRQTSGGVLSRLDSLVTQVFIQLGFAVAATALTAPLLVLCGLSSTLACSLCSAAMGLFTGGYALTYPARRRAASGVGTPLYVRLDVSLLALVAVLLIANAIGRPWPPRAGPLALGLTGTLFVAGIAYLHWLGALHRQVDRR
jgi:hypothetical protein